MVTETRLKKARIAAGLSQSDLEEKSGVSVRMIQHYEQGVKDINRAAVATVQKLAEALHVGIADILED